MGDSTPSLHPPEHYVYIVKDFDGAALYIGSGKGNRYRHALHGKSHNKQLNKFHQTGEIIFLDIVEDSLTKDESITVEFDLIARLAPKFNVRINPPASASK